MEAKDRFQKLRDAIDRIDSEILSLLLKRRDIAVQIGNIKRVLNYPIYDAERERELLERLKCRVQEGAEVKKEDKDAACEDVVAVFKEILAASRRAQE
jgi:chorismate mutase